MTEEFNLSEKIIGRSSSLASNEKIKKFHKHIGFSIPRKQKKLNEIITHKPIFWQKKEIKYLLKNDGEKKAKEIGDFLKRSIGAIRTKKYILKKNGMD